MRDWTFAKAWLLRAMSPDDAPRAVSVTGRAGPVHGGFEHLPDLRLRRLDPRHERRPLGTGPQRRQVDVALEGRGTQEAVVHGPVQPGEGARGIADERVRPRRRRTASRRRCTAAGRTAASPRGPRRSGPPARPASPWRMPAAAESPRSALPRARAAAMASARPAHRAEQPRLDGVAAAVQLVERQREGALVVVGVQDAGGHGRDRAARRRGAPPPTRRAGRRSGRRGPARRTRAARRAAASRGRAAGPASRRPGRDRSRAARGSTARRRCPDRGQARGAATPQPCTSCDGSSNLPSTRSIRPRSAQAAANSASQSRLCTKKAWA